MKSSDYDSLVIANEVWIEELMPDYPVVRINNSHASATIALHGAHVIDYIPYQQAPVIFTSCEAIFKEGKAIRGGIPICWPWFGAHPTNSQLPSHGFARNRFWKIISSQSCEKYSEIVLRLDTAELDLDFWPTPTTATLSIRVGETLEVVLTSHNYGDSPVQIGGALHSYFQVADIKQVTIDGLDQCRYLDTVTDQNDTQQGSVSISGEVDRVYLGTAAATIINDPGFERQIWVEKAGSQTTVVWNPWTDKAAALADLADEEFYDFVCVETCNALDDVHRLAPGESHTLKAIIHSKKKA